MWRLYLWIWGVTRVLHDGVEPGSLIVSLTAGGAGPHVSSARGNGHIGWQWLSENCTIGITEGWCRYFFGSWNKAHKCHVILLMGNITWQCKYRYRGVLVMNLLDCKETGGGGGTCWCGVETLGVILWNSSWVITLTVRNWPKSICKKYRYISLWRVLHKSSD